MKGMFKNKEEKGSNARILWFGVAFVALALLLVAGLQVYASHKVSDVLAKGLPPNMEVRYGNLHINVLLGHIGFSSFEYKLYRGKDREVELEALLGTLEIKGLDYWTLWKEGRWSVDRIKVGNARVAGYDTESDNLSFALQKGRLELRGFKTDSLLFRQKLPFAYKTLKFKGDGMFLNLGPFEALTVATLSHDGQDLEFEDVRITSKYGRDLLSQKLEKERDHIDLCVPRGSVGGLALGTVNDSVHLGAEKVELLGPELRLYRDKLLPDDRRTKPLYGSLLRDLPLKLDIDDLAIENASVSYSERVRKGEVPVSISFGRLRAGIHNLSNTNTRKTEIEARAFLMDEAPVQLQWKFNSSSPADRFYASATLKDLKAEAINPFLESQAKVRVKGHIQEMYFTLSGDDLSSRGDMKMKYRNFKFSVLDEDRLGVDKVLTLIVNLITNDGSKTDEKGYRHGRIAVERDRSKSFFNYLWLNLRDGLKNTVVGNGKKKEE